MSLEEKKRIIDELVSFEREEKDLISLYQSLLEVGAASSLPASKRTEFRQSLEKLYEDSKRHLGAVASLIAKYK